MAHTKTGSILLPSGEEGGINRQWGGTVRFGLRFSRQVRGGASTDGSGFQCRELTFSLDWSRILADLTVNELAEIRGRCTLLKWSASMCLMFILTSCESIDSLKSGTKPKCTYYRPGVAEHVYMGHGRLGF